MEIQHLERMRSQARYGLPRNPLPPFRLVTNDKAYITATMQHLERPQLDIADVSTLVFRENSEQKYILVVVARLYERFQIVTLKRLPSQLQELRNLRIVHPVQVWTARMLVCECRQNQAFGLNRRFANQRSPIVLAGMPSRGSRALAV